MKYFLIGYKIRCYEDWKYEKIWGQSNAEKRLDELKKVDFEMQSVMCPFEEEYHEKYIKE